MAPSGSSCTHSSSTRSILGLSRFLRWVRSERVLHGYVGIRFGHNNILIALFCAFIHAVAFVAYCAIFQRAYRLGDMQKQLKQELSAVCGRRTNRSFRNEMLRATAALQCKGMQVGSFHEMERNSALIFIDFVERQLISLLVAF